MLSSLREESLERGRRVLWRSLIGDLWLASGKPWMERLLVSESGPSQHWMEGASVRCSHRKTNDWATFELTNNERLPVKHIDTYKMTMATVSRHVWMTIRPS